MQGTIMRSTGSWYEVLTPTKEIIKCRLRGKFKIKGLKVTNPLAVGDEIIFEIENQAENTGIITEILERSNYIIRKSVHKTAHAHLIASNLDQAALIATLDFPRTSLGFIDRFLVTAETFRIPSLVVFNKVDLHHPDMEDYLAEIQSIYEPLGYTFMLTSALTGEGIEEFTKALENKKTLVSGHSGVGKSSIINQINPNLKLKTSQISTFANKGRHTTTFAEMFELQENTFIIDTPGIKELGLVDIEKQELGHYFPEIRERLGMCKFNDCLHENEPKCAIIEAVEVGEIHPARYESYLSMLYEEDTHR